MNPSDLEIRDVIALSLMPGITSAVLRSLLEARGPFAQIVRAPAEWLASQGVKRNGILAVSDPAIYLERAEQQIAIAAKLGAEIVHFWQDSYPPRLREIFSPPAVLYVMGKLSADDSAAIGVVGTRMASTYGRLAA